jgi:hypothetical protein
MTSKGDVGYGTMFSSILRRSRRGSRRPDLDVRDPSVSPSSAPPRQRHFTGRTHATADFTEADDDDDDTNEEELIGFDEEAAGVNHQDGEDDQDDEDAEEGADEDNRRRALPVLPLFSATHLGNHWQFFFPSTFLLHWFDLAIHMACPYRFPFVQAIQPWAVLTRPRSRYAANLQHHPLHSHNCERPHRDDTIVGPTSIPSSLPVPGEADATANPDSTLLQGNHIRTHGKLPAVLQGRTEVCC